MLWVRFWDFFEIALKRLGRDIDIGMALITAHQSLLVQTFPLSKYNTGGSSSLAEREKGLGIMHVLAPLSPDCFALKTAGKLACKNIHFFRKNREGEARRMENHPFSIPPHSPHPPSMFALLIG